MQYTTSITESTQHRHTHTQFMNCLLMYDLTVSLKMIRSLTFTQQYMKLTFLHFFKNLSQSLQPVLGPRIIARAFKYISKRKLNQFTQILSSFTIIINITTTTTTRSFLLSQLFSLVRPAYLTHSLKLQFGPDLR